MVPLTLIRNCSYEFTPWLRLLLACGATRAAKVAAEVLLVAAGFQTSSALAAVSGSWVRTVWVPTTAVELGRTVTLANGRIWRQLSGDTDFAHWTKPASTYEARVTRGALGSLNLKVKGESEAFKVEQVK